MVSVIGGIWLCRRCKKPVQPGAVIQQRGQGKPATIALQNSQVQTSYPTEIPPQYQYLQPTAPPNPPPTAPLHTPSTAQPHPLPTAPPQLLLPATATATATGATAPPLQLLPAATAPITRPQILNPSRLTRNILQSQLEDTLSSETLPEASFEGLASFEGPDLSCIGDMSSSGIGDMFSSGIGDMFSSGM